MQRHRVQRRGTRALGAPFALGVVMHPARSGRSSVIPWLAPLLGAVTLGALAACGSSSTTGFGSDYGAGGGQLATPPPATPDAATGVTPPASGNEAGPMQTATLEAGSGDDASMDDASPAA